MTTSGCTVLGLGGKGNLSDVPELGGVNAEAGKVGKWRFLRRRPNPGEGGTGGSIPLILYKLVDSTKG